jgi:putative ABC transport system substrate-binding protein
MNKKLAPIIVATATLLITHLAEAQQSAGKLPTIGVLSGGLASDPRNALRLYTLRLGLPPLGYIEGKNINFEYRYAEAKPERLTELAKELVGLKVAIIFAMDSDAAQATKKATTTIPIIVATGGDPVTSGLVASLARPGGNITGFALISPQLVEKRLGLLKEAVPKLSRIAYLMPAGSVTIKANFDDAQGTAKILKVKFQAIEVKAPDPDFEDVFRFMVKERIGGLVTEGPPFIASNRKKILDLAVRYRIPAIHPTQVWATDGGLMSYGADAVEPFRRAAVFIDKILKGVKPSEIPVELPMKYEFVINLQTAKQIGVTIPQSVLFRADKVIQ